MYNVQWTWNYIVSYFYFSMRTLCLKCPCFLFLGFHHFDPLEFSIFHLPAAVWESVYLCCFFFLCLPHNDIIWYLWICIIMHRVLKRHRESLEERWLCASLRKQTFQSLGRFPSYCWSLIQTYFLYWHHTRYLERGMICTFYWQPQRSLRLTGFSTHSVEEVCRVLRKKPAPLSLKYSFVLNIKVLNHFTIPHI